MWWHPKSKFETLFNSIGELLTLGAIVGAFIFLIGYGLLFKLLGWEWYNDNAKIDLWVSWILGVLVVALWFMYQMKKDKEDRV